MEKQEKQDLPAGRHPSWLRVRAPFGEKVHELKKLMAGLNLNTVCQEARCPNMGECWAHGVATFMILGDVCTRGCRYCAVSKGTPSQVDWVEPERVGEAVRAMDLSHVVITSVDRDDLDDGGADLFARTVLAVRRRSPKCVVEVLIPDFQGSAQALQTVLESGPEIVNHNIETVPRLYPQARGGGEYTISLEVSKILSALGRARTGNPSSTRAPSTSDIGGLSKPKLPGGGLKIPPNPEPSPTPCTPR